MARRPVAGLPIGERVMWFQVLDVLGHGGFGVTYRARDMNLEREVALKEYFPAHCATRALDARQVLDNGTRPGSFEWGLRRFREEAQNLARVRHPSVVEVQAVFEDNGTAYMAMDLVRGAGLQAALEHGLVADEHHVLYIARGLLAGLEVVHEAGIVHRDIKPDNVLLRADLTPVLVDFGSARRELAAHGRPLTAVVSAGFSPIEQYGMQRFDGAQGPWTDIYSTGALLYTLVSGRAPLDAIARASTLLDCGEDPLRSLATLGPEGYSAGLCAAIDAALELRPAARPQSVAALRALLPPGGDVAPGEVPAAVFEKVAARARGIRRARSAAAPTTKLPVTSGGTIVDSAELAAARQLQVLVVEPRRAQGNQVRRALEAAGVRGTIVVADVAAALSGIGGGHQAADLVICNLLAANAEGVTLARRLAAVGYRGAVAFYAAAERGVLEAAAVLAREHGLDVVATLGEPLDSRALRRALAATRRPDPVTTRARAHELDDAEVRDGLAAGALQLAFQPVVHATSREVVAIEALARWQHADGYILTPGEFLPAVRRAGCLDQLTEAALAAAVREAGNWHARGHDLQVGINFEAEHLDDLAWPGRLLGAIEHEGLLPGRVIVEIAAPIFTTEREALLEIATRLRLLGMSLCLDHFGAGGSAIEHVAALPFNHLKLDFELVGALSHKDAATDILAACVDFAHRRGINIIATGVADEATWETVVDFGCAFVQGFAIAAPMADSRVVPWLEGWQGGTRG